VREKIARHLAGRTGVPFRGEHVVMTVGAGGALNVLFRAMLDPGDEVILLSPYFVEYGFYIRNSGGVPVEVATSDDFGPPPAEALARAIGPRTRALIINFPNNPTGRIYTRAELARIADALREGSRRIGSPIALVTDEPYRKIVYDDIECPEVPPAYDYTVLITSHSKDLGLAGERIGYLAVSPRAPEPERLVAACTFSNRILGFVNAPSLFQLAVADCQDLTVDLTLYRENRRILLDHLTELGFSIVPPGGAFYLFPRSPVADETQFVARLLRERILVVPGCGFGTPGHFRISYAVPRDVVERSLPGWSRVAAEYTQLSPTGQRSP
jgi:aspartate aminotransferase